MKTKLDPRHKKRQRTVKLLFAHSFHKSKVHNNSIIAEIYNNLDFIDKQIVKIAPSFPIEKINKIDLAILRLATYELLLKQEQPKKVIVDEAVELAKEFGGETSPPFINGALGNLLKKLNTKNEI